MPITAREIDEDGGTVIVREEEQFVKVRVMRDGNGKIYTGYTDGANGAHLYAEGEELTLPKATADMYAYKYWVQIIEEEGVKAPAEVESTDGANAEIAEKKKLGRQKVI